MVLFGASAAYYNCTFVKGPESTGHIRAVSRLHWDNIPAAFKHGADVLLEDCKFGSGTTPGYTLVADNRGSNTSSHFFSSTSIPPVCVLRSNDAREDVSCKFEPAIVPTDVHISRFISSEDAWIQKVLQVRNMHPVSAQNALHHDSSPSMHRLILSSQTRDAAAVANHAFTCVLKQSQSHAAPVHFIALQ